MPLAPTGSDPGPITRTIDALPGWICVLGGCLLLGMLLIAPAYLKVRATAWERDLMALQAERLDQQREKYERFELALRSDDPVLLERLAFTELRQKPAESSLLDPGPGIMLASQVEIIPDTGAAVAYRVDHSAPGSIQAWLHVPMPVVGLGGDIAPLPVLQSYLIRISTGPHRVIALLIAVLIVVMGLLLNGPRRPEPAEL